MNTNCVYMPAINAETIIKKWRTNMLFTTDLRKKAEKYLTAPIEKNTFFPVEVAVQKDKDSVILIAPIDISTDPHFRLIYGKISKWFTNLQSMLDYCVEQGYINKNAIEKIKERYKTEQPIHYKEERYGWKNRRV